jgi:hypothetical protein
MRMSEGQNTLAADRHGKGRGSARVFVKIAGSARETVHQCGDWLRMDGAFFEKCGA